MIEHLFQYYARSELGTAIRDSQWAFAVIEMVHLLGLAILGGAIIVGALGSAGWYFAFPDRRGSWRNVRPVLVTAFVTTAASGVLLVASNPLKYYFNDAFGAKMLLLAVGLILLVLLNALVKREAPSALWLHRAIALVTLSVWLCVGLAGRLIGLL